MAENKVEFFTTSIPYSGYSGIKQLPDSNKAFAINNNVLYEFIFSTDPHPTIRTSQDRNYPLKNATLLYVEPIDKTQTAVIVKITEGIRIYLHSELDNTLQLAVEDVQYHDVYEWNKPGNVIQFGHFYHDPSIFGMMTSHVKNGMNFYAIFKDILLSGEFPIHPLTTSLDIFDVQSPKFVSRTLADVNRTEKRSIVSRNPDGLSIFEFNQANGVDFLMKIPHCGATVYEEGIFFADLTYQKFNDMLHFNASGLFLYQYQETYKFIHYNPLFSEQKGWNEVHTKSVRFADINSDGFDDMVFTGPKGISAITYDRIAHQWDYIIEPSFFPPNMRHAQIMTVIPKAQDIIGDNHLFVNFQGIIYRGRIVIDTPSSLRGNNTLHTIPKKVLLTSDMTPSRNTSPNFIKPLGLLRDMNIWSDILNCVGQETGKPKFELPLIDLPDPQLKLIIRYDATITANDVLGIGWTMPLNFIVMDDYGSVFDEDAVFLIIFQDSPQALEFLAKESNSDARVYTLPSRDGILKFRAKFYTNEDVWVIDLGNGVKQFYGQTRTSKTGAVSRNIVWKNWHGPGFDSDNQVERSRMWYLANVQDEKGFNVLEFFYDKETENVNSGLTYTKGVYLSRIRDFLGNEVEFRYAEKLNNEYKTYDSQDTEGNYNWVPVQSRYIAGYTFSKPSSGKQIVNFIYETSNGQRFLTEFRQVGDVVDSFVAKFKYLSLPKQKFSLEYVHLPYGVKVDFKYAPVGQSNPSAELRRIEVSSDYKVTADEKFVLVSYISGNGPGQVILRMFNRDMNEELYTSASSVKTTTKGRWPLLGDHQSVVAHDVMKGSDFFVVILFYATSKSVCLFGYSAESDEWIKESKCHEYDEEADIKIGSKFCIVTDRSSKIDIFDWKSSKGTWTQQAISFNEGRPVVAVYEHRFVTYDDNALAWWYKDINETWIQNSLANIPKCLSGSEALLKRFKLKSEVHKIFSAGLRNNALKIHQNLIALNCLELSSKQLQSSINIFLLDRHKHVKDQQRIVVLQENIETFESNEQRDSYGNYFKFKYVFTRFGDFYIKVADFRGPVKDQLKGKKSPRLMYQITDPIEEMMNSPASRLLFEIRDYIMKLSNKVIKCRDQKFTFGGNKWHRSSVKKSDKAMESFTTKLGDQFILEKVNKESTIKLIRLGERKILSDLAVNATDVRMFFPVYVATQTRGTPIRVVEFDENNVKEKSYSITETLSPHSNPLLLITHEGQSRKIVIFRQQYGIKKLIPNHVVRTLTVEFDNDRKKRVTGYEYFPETARLSGNSIVYSKVAIIPANDRISHGWLERSLTDGKTTAYNNRGEIVRHIPNQERDRDKIESEEEEAFRKATTIYDKSGLLEIARCAPFQPKDETVGYFGFEDYESNVIGSSKKWNFEASNVVRNGFALTGRNYLHQTAQPIEGIFKPVNQNNEYIASSWVRLHNITAFPRIGEIVPYLKAIVFDDAGNEVISLLSEIKFRLYDWFYLELYVDLSLARGSLNNNTFDGKPLQIAVRVGPTLTTPIDIDHVRFTPLISDFNVDIFDPDTHLNTAVIQPTGSILRRVYDVYSAVVGRINEQSQLEELVVSTKATEQETPRSTIKIKPEMGFYEQFAPFSFANHWKITEKSPWKIAPYQLEHYGDQINNLELDAQDIDTNSYGFRMFYSFRDDHASLAIMNLVKLSKQFNKSFLNIYNQRPQAIPSEGEILFVTEKDRMLVWIDGGLIVDQSFNDLNNPLKLSISGTVAIEDMMVFSKASIQVIYQNTLDEPVQEISLESFQSILVKQKLYDELGRQRITTQQVSITRQKHEPLLGALDNFVTNDNINQMNSIWNTGLLEGLVTSILGHPYGFAEIRYDRNPLNEKTLVGYPGKEFSISGSFAKRFASKPTNSFVTNRFPLSMNVSYQVELKLGGVEDVTVFNSKNRKIAHFVHVPGSKDMFSTYKLDKDGNLLQTLPPLYFEKVGSFHKTNSELLNIDEDDLQLQRKLGTHIDYDHNGKPIRKTTADTGPFENIYDHKKLLRFVLHYSYVEPERVETIIYFIYDELERLTGTGQFFDTSIPKNTLLSVPLDSNNSLEYQSFNYANFERNPTLRGKLLRSITMNGDEPYAEVIHVNERGDVLEKRIILPNLTDNIDEIAIRKRYLAGRLQMISYPSRILGQEFVVEYGYDRLGRINTIGTPADPGCFLKMAHNADGQVIEETYEPTSLYSFKLSREYNEPGFLTKISSPFQTEEISFTESSYGGVNRGDGSITRIKFTASWHNISDLTGAGLTPDSFVTDFMSKIDSKICFDALKKAGYLDTKNRQVKAFYPDLEMHFPIICTSGISGRHVSNVLGHHGSPREHGYRFDYGDHQDLTKAKYFVGSEEPQPLQPNTFSKEIPEISSNASLRIWQALKSAKFLIEDPDRKNLSSSHGKQGRKDFIASNLFQHLRDVSPDYASYAMQLRKLLMSRFSKRQEPVSLLQFQDLFRQWLGEPSASFVQRTAANIYEMLRQKRYFSNPLDSEFQNILSEFRVNFPEIARVLFEYFGKQLGRSEFDVESYEIDANGNHKLFNTGYAHYGLVYEENSNRIKGVRYKAFDSHRPEEVFQMPHDSRGNVIQALHKGIQLMEYHPVSNYLQRVKMVDGRVVRFYYDSKGERVLKQSISPEGQVLREVHYLRDEQGRTLLEKELSYLIANQPPAVLVTMYIYGSSGLKGFVRRDQFYSVLTDHQGSIRLIVRDGEVVAAYDYLPYGNLMRVFGTDPEAHISYRYTGQEWDSEIGLYNYHARFYDPSIGRFYQMDPKEQYFSPYKYAGNSPISMVDPTGEEAILLFCIAFMFIGMYFGGASANGSFKLNEWEWDSWRTYVGVIVGGISGFFFPIGFVASVGLVGLGWTVIAGLGMAYFSAAAANDSFDPSDWDMSSPQTWMALFDGFAMGTSIFSNFHNVGRFYAQLSLNGKRIFVATSVLAGSGLFVMGGVATNWDLKKPQFWFATISSIASAPNLGMFLVRGASVTRSGWRNFKTNFKVGYANYVDSYFTLRKDFGRSVAQALRESALSNRELRSIGKSIASATAVGVSAFLIAGALNYGFTNWNMTDMSTYQSLLTAIQMGSQAGTAAKHGMYASIKKLQLRRATKAEKLCLDIGEKATKIYKDLITFEYDETVVRKGGKKVKQKVKYFNKNDENNNANTKTLLDDKKIPNTAMSVVVVGDFAMVGFSTNRAPGIYLVYEHKNLANPTFRAGAVADNNGIVGGRVVNVRDDATLSYKIQKAVDDVQNGIKQNNKNEYLKRNIRQLVARNAERIELVDRTVIPTLVENIHNEMLASGYVDRQFISRQLNTLGVQTPEMRDAIQKAQRAQDRFNEISGANKGAKNKARDELNRENGIRNEITKRHMGAYTTALHEPVRDLSSKVITYDIHNCAEPHTLLSIERQNELFKKVFFKPKSSDIQLDVDYMATFETKNLPQSLTVAQRCGNCMVTTSLVENVLTDTNWKKNLQYSMEKSVLQSLSSLVEMRSLTPMFNLRKTMEYENERNRHGKHKRAIEPVRRTWFKNPLQLVRKWWNSTNESFTANQNETILELGDEYFSKVDVNGTFLLTDVILAKCQHRKLHQMKNDTVTRINDAELLCNLVQLLEDSLEEAAAMSGISLNQLNIDGFTMQQEVLPMLRKREFNKIPGVMLKYALTSMDTEITEESFDAFQTALRSLKLSETFEELFFRIQQHSKRSAGDELAYIAHSGRENYTTHLFKSISALPHGQKLLN